MTERLMTEPELTDKVVMLVAKLRGEGLDLELHHCRDSRYCIGRKGLPDLLIIGPMGHIFRELKSEAGDTRPDQDWWLWSLARPADGLLHCGLARAAIWRPADLRSGRVERELKILAR